MFARIMGLIILALEARGLYLSIYKRGLGALVYYTQISNVVAAISALALLVFGQPMWVTVLRYLACCMLIMTFFVTVCVLIPLGGDPKKLLLTGSCLYNHVLCPVISTVSYIFVENHVGFGWIVLPVLITLVYGSIMFYLNYIEKMDGPYPFFRVHNQSVGMSVLWFFVLLGAITLFSWLLCLIAR